MPVYPRHWLLALALSGIIPLFFIDLDHWVGNIPSELHAFAHVGFFALLAFLLMELPLSRHQSFLWRAAQVLLVLLLVSVVIELIQSLFGRSADLRDIRQNLVGALVAISLYSSAGTQRQLIMGLATIFLALELTGPGIGLWDRYVARTQFPVLGEFETRFEHRRWSSGVRDAAVARDGTYSLRLDLEPGRYAGTTLQRSFGDWSDYAHLEMSLYNPGDAPFPMSLSIRDHKHFERGGHYADRFNTTFNLERGWNDLRFAITGIREAPAERSLDLSDLSEIVVFAANLQEATVIYLDRVRLSLE